MPLRDVTGKHPGLKNLVLSVRLAPKGSLSFQVALSQGEKGCFGCMGLVEGLVRHGILRYKVNNVLTGGFSPRQR